MAQVVQQQRTFQKLNADIVAISFGTVYWAKVWLAETAVSFPLLLDQDRNAYQAFGLESSVLRSWGLKNMRYYANAIRSGKKFLGTRGNANQLGGDFIIDKQGIIQLAYPSHDPTDRPSINQILTTLHSIN